MNIKLFREKITKSEDCSCKDTTILYTREVVKTKTINLTDDIGFMLSLSQKANTQICVVLEQLLQIKVQFSYFRIFRLDY